MKDVSGEENSRSQMVDNAIRWLAPEVYFDHTMTLKSDVFSFARTALEVSEILNADQL